MKTENSSPFFAETPVKRFAVYSVHFPFTLDGKAELEDGGGPQKLYNVLSSESLSKERI